MKWNFDLRRVTPWYMTGIVLFLGWTVWTSAQTNTNVAATVSTTNTTAAATPPEAEASERLVVSFGLENIEELNVTVFGFPLWQYIASLIFIFLAFYVSKLLDFIIGAKLSKWAEKTNFRFARVILGLIRGPVKVVSFVVLLHIGLQAFAWPDWLAGWLSKGLKIVVACSITYMALKFIDLLLNFWQQRMTQKGDQTFNQLLFPIMQKSFKVFVVVVAVLVTSQNLGLNVTGMIASLSIGGLALGLAAQDTLANLFGAVSIFVDEPFRIGDRVQLDTIDGTVETIGLRSTRIRNLDGHLITVPNKTMGNATITNVTKRPNIKTVMNIGITYDTPTEKVKQALAILQELYRGHPMTFDVIISFNQFADSSLNIQVIHWWNSTDVRPYLAGIQELNLAVKERFDTAGINFAFPTQTLYVKQDSQWRLQNGLGPAETADRPRA